MKIKTRYEKKVLKNLEGKKLVYETIWGQKVNAVVVGVDKYIGVTVAASEDFVDNYGTIYKKGQWLSCVPGPMAPNYDSLSTKSYVRSFENFVDRLLELKKGDILEPSPNSEKTNENACPYNQ